VTRGINILEAMMGSETK